MRANESAAAVALLRQERNDAWESGGECSRRCSIRFVGRIVVFCSVVMVGGVYDCLLCYVVFGRCVFESLEDCCFDVSHGRIRVGIWTS